MIETCQIYLLTPPVIDNLEIFLENLKSALSAAPVACVQIRLKDLEDSVFIQTGISIRNSGKMIWTIFHLANCLAGMLLLASPVIIRRGLRLKRPQRVRIMWRLAHFLRPQRKNRKRKLNWRF